MKRTVPNRLGLYADVRQVLDTALLSNGGVYTCASHGAAVHWRQRAYKFRKLYAEIHGEDKFSPYDSLSMKQIPPDSSDVIITFRTVAGKFVPNEEPVVDMDVQAEPLIGDELFDEAMALAKKISSGGL